MIKFYTQTNFHEMLYGLAADVLPIQVAHSSKEGCRFFKTFKSDNCLYFYLNGVKLMTPWKGGKIHLNIRVLHALIGKGWSIM